LPPHRADATFAALCLVPAAQRTGMAQQGWCFLGGGWGLFANLLTSPQVG
jgi:hypothetical protein